MKIDLNIKIVFIAFMVGLILTTCKIIRPISVVAQNEITILRKAEKAVNSLPGWTLPGKYDKATALATLAIAEQLKRIADALERR